MASNKIALEGPSDESGLKNVDRYGDTDKWRTKMAQFRTHY